MIAKMIKGASMAYLTCASDMLKNIEDLEKAGWPPQKIIKHLKQCGRSADIAIDVMLRDMEIRDLAAKASSKMRRMSSPSKAFEDG